MEYDYLPLGSLVLGLFAWALPFLAIKKFNKMKDIQGTYLVCSSFVCAMLSLLFVITYRQYLIRMEDWSALMDTQNGFQVSAVGLTVIAIVLNGFALGVKGRNQSKINNS